MSSQTRRVARTLARRRGLVKINADSFCAQVSKYGYVTKARADDVLAFLKGRGEKRVYECPWCHHWHLTSKAEELA